MNKSQEAVCPLCKTRFKTLAEMNKTHFVRKSKSKNVSNEVRGGMKCEGCQCCKLKPRVHNFSEASKHAQNCGFGIWALEPENQRLHPSVPLLPQDGFETVQITNAILANLANSATKEPKPKKRKLTDSGDKRQAGGSATKPKPKRKKLTWISLYPSCFVN